jgi:hypothetical protein
MILKKTYPTISAVPCNVAIPIEIQAKHLFISHYVVGPSPTLNYIVAFYPPTASEGHLHHSFRAVTLAYLAMSKSSPEILQTARRYYSRALSLTNKAIGVPNVAFHDRTLFAILLLDLFQNIADNLFQNNTAEDCSNEMEHLCGALTLVKLRGASQFIEPVRVGMFLHLSSNILIKCLKRGIDAPPLLLSLRDEAAEYIPSDDRAWLSLNSTIRVVAIWAALKRGEPVDAGGMRTLHEMEIQHSALLNKSPYPWKLKDELNLLHGLHEQDTLPTILADPL